MRFFWEIKFTIYFKTINSGTVASEVDWQRGCYYAPSSESVEPTKHCYYKHSHSNSHFAGSGSLRLLLVATSSTANNTHYCYSVYCLQTHLESMAEPSTTVAGGKSMASTNFQYQKALVVVAVLPNRTFLVLSQKK